MVRYTGKKNRIARRFGVNIFGRARNPLLHKSSPPGQHGAKRRKKSDFGVQLEEKQKLKAVYGMLTEKQLLRYFNEAVRRKGNTANHLMEMLECRLDNVVYRMKFASTIFGAHQLVSHGHICVNGQKVDIRSFQVKPGMVVSVRDKSRSIKVVQESVTHSGRTVPAYIGLEGDGFSGKLLAPPVMGEISLPLEIDIPTVCDFLAHSS